MLSLDLSEPPSLTIRLKSGGHLRIQKDEKFDNDIVKRIVTTEIEKNEFIRIIILARSSTETIVTPFRKTLLDIKNVLVLYDIDAEKPNIYVPLYIEIKISKNITGEIKATFLNYECILTIVPKQLSFYDSFQKVSYQQDLTPLY